MVYKGYIKVSNDGTFYPITRIKALYPVLGDCAKTQIEFDDNSSIIVNHTMTRTISLLKEGEN